MFIKKMALGLLHKLVSIKYTSYQGALLVLIFNKHEHNNFNIFRNNHGRMFCLLTQQGVFPIRLNPIRRN